MKPLQRKQEILYNLELQHLRFTLKRDNFPLLQSERGCNSVSGESDYESMTRVVLFTSVDYPGRFWGDLVRTFSTAYNVLTPSCILLSCIRNYVKLFRWAKVKNRVLKRLEWRFVIRKFCFRYDLKLFWHMGKWLSVSTCTFLSALVHLFPLHFQFPTLLNLGNFWGKCLWFNLNILSEFTSAVWSLHQKQFCGKEGGRFAIANIREAC